MLSAAKLAYFHGRCMISKCTTADVFLKEPEKNIIVPLKQPASNIQYATVTCVDIL